MVLSLEESLQKEEVLEDLLLNPQSFRFRDAPEVVVAAEQWVPHVLMRQGETGNLTASGPMINLLDMMSRSINFTYRLVRPSDGSWGAPLPNGSWSGMVGVVQREAADMGLGPFAVTRSRSLVVAFSQTLFFEDVVILASKGKPEHNPWGFLFPLAPAVWAALLMAMTCTWAALLILGVWDFGSGRVNRALDALFLQIRTLLRQGMDCDLPGSAGRWVVGGWLLVAMVTTWSYTGNLMSLLVRAGGPSPHPIGQRSTYQRHHGTGNTKEGILAELHALLEVGRMHHKPLNMMAQFLGTLVRDGTHVLFIDGSTSLKLQADIFSKTGRCEFYKARETFMPLFYAMIGKKDSPLIPAIDARIQQLLASGLYNKWVLSAIPNATACVSLSTSITVKEPLTLATTWGMFVVLVCGLSLALICFVVEVFFPRLSVETSGDQASRSGFTKEERNLQEISLEAANGGKSLLPQK
ncbi:olfactory ionotropic receptor IR4 [Penaeus vannamei]|uniref:Olfactory ionotropic receptor IR4 n=1 Tax=Penaeus vannamei TaxID=6689 RepID=A0A3R7M7U5_PENVA|nr:olfactory ionotropic receptor IR4 [Penaeus vannamei]